MVAHVYRIAQGPELYGWWREISRSQLSSITTVSMVVTAVHTWRGWTRDCTIWFVQLQQSRVWYLPYFPVEFKLVQNNTKPAGFWKKRGNNDATRSDGHRAFQIIPVVDRLLCLVGVSDRVNLAEKPDVGSRMSTATGWVNSTAILRVHGVDESSMQ